MLSIQKIFTLIILAMSSGILVGWNIKLPAQAVYYPTVYSTETPISTITSSPTSTQQVAIVNYVTDTPVIVYVIQNNPVQENIIQDIPVVYPTETPTAENVFYNDMAPDSVPTLVYPLTYQEGPFVNFIGYTIVPTTDIDDAWDSVATPQPQIDLKQPQCVFPLQGPYVIWRTALGLAFKETDYGKGNGDIIEITSHNISLAAQEGGAYFPDNGVVSVSEADVTVKLYELYNSGRLLGCYDVNGGANAYGPGVQEFLDWLQGYIKYE